MKKLSEDDKDGIIEHMNSIKNRSLKQLLWLGIGSMVMFFAGLTSAYVVAKPQEHWIDFILPDWFFFSTLTIVISSIMLITAQARLKKEKSSVRESQVSASMAMMCQGRSELNRESTKSCISSCHRIFGLRCNRPRPPSGIHVKILVHQQSSMHRATRPAHCRL